MIYLLSSDHLFITDDGGGKHVAIAQNAVNNFALITGVIGELHLARCFSRVIVQEVTSSLEVLLGGVKGIREVSSLSSKSYGRINLSFKKTVNPDAASF